MSRIQVATLKLKCRADQRDRVRFAIEDSLRTSIPDDRRLVLLRKMQVRGTVNSLHPATRDAAVRESWLAAIAGARHGDDDGAADANCVWFASRVEAETLLLSRLLAGRPIHGWYWKLAVPDWRGRPVRMWLADLISEALGRGEDQRVFSIARCFVAAGSSEQLIELFASEGTKPRLTVRPIAAKPASAIIAAERQQGPTDFEDMPAQAIVSSMPPELRRAIVALDRTGGEASLLGRAMVRAWVLKRSPALALSPALLATIIAATVELVISRRFFPPPGLAARGKATPSRREPARSRSKRRTTSARKEVAAEEQQRQTPAAPAHAEAVNHRAPGPDVLPDGAPYPFSQRVHSAHAGLWLVVPSLIELGFREWLAQRRELLGTNPASRLLHEIGRHNRVAVDDPALVVLGPLADAESRPEWVLLWRHGLDRWLRRTVRRRLHDLVSRSGELDFGELELVVHYPAAAADIALRRQALDRDPGWTDWLGLSVRYNFGGTEGWA
jgi:hypothetical protein